MRNKILVPITIAALIVSYYIWQATPDHIRHGGPLLVLVMTLFFLALTFAIERFIVLWRAGGRGDIRSFIAGVKDSIHESDIAAAIAACKQQGGSLANVVGAGLESYHRRAAAPGRVNDDALAETRRAMQEANALEAPNLEQNLTALSTIAAIATLIGLLGTVIGMIRAFHAMSRAGAPDATQLAIGISEALVNTAFGLVTAIVATVLFNYFTTQVDAFNNRVEEASYEILKLLEFRKES
jgi:biopolymer transport protein ExbB